MNKLLLIFSAVVLLSCQYDSQDVSSKITVIFDTDANNELDDQHALAYLLLNGNTFNVAGVTVNATRSGGDISKQYAEAERIMTLCTVNGKIPLLKGANASFQEIKDSTARKKFDGSDAVQFIIAKADSFKSSKLTVLAVGKLTDVALALKKDPSIASKIRVVWLGSNYPEPGEYNLDNDTAALNYVLRTNVDFEMVTVRYSKQTGSGAVRAAHVEISQRMPGKGPTLSEGITGRHGGTFANFGDYSANLFDHIDYHSQPEARALFDMVAVAIVKNPGWGQQKQIPRPIYLNSQWKEQPKNPRKITIWENFDKIEIMKDFYATMEHWVIAKAKT